MSVHSTWNTSAEEETNAHSIIQQIANMVTDVQINNVPEDTQVKRTLGLNQDKSNIDLTQDVKTQDQGHQEKHYQPAPQDHEGGSKRKQPRSRQGKVHQTTKRKRKVQEIDPHRQVERKKKEEENHPKAQLTW